MEITSVMEGFRVKSGVLVWGLNNIPVSEGFLSVSAAHEDVEGGWTVSAVHGFILVRDVQRHCGSGHFVVHYNHLGLMLHLFLPFQGHLDRAITQVSMQTNCDELKQKTEKRL